MTVEIFLVSDWFVFLKLMKIILKKTFAFVFESA